MGSFSTPLSGLLAAQQQLQTVSNNLANQNTNGYKDQTLTFSDIFAQTGATNGAGDPMQTGTGVQVSSTTSDLTEGNLASGGEANMAISGNGYFITKGSDGQLSYTRAGDFTTNKAGQITAPDGDVVLGYQATNGVVNTNGVLGPLNVGKGSSIQATPSTTVSITANLNANVSSPATVTPTTSVSGTNTVSDYDFGTSGTVSPTTTLTISDGTHTTAVVTPTPGESTTAYAAQLTAAMTAAGVTGVTVSGAGNQLTITGPTATTTMAGNLKQDAAGVGLTSSPIVYDSLGNSHTLSVAYTKTAANTWTYSVSIPTADVTSGGTGNTVIGSGTLNFSTSGNLTSISNVTPISIPSFADGAAAMTLSGPFGSSSAYTVTQTATTSTTSATNTDGFAGGTLKSYTIEKDGTIEGTFTGGQTLALGQVALASFANVQGLTNVGNNSYQPTIASGSAVVGQANAGGRGTITGQEVEQSNVNIASEFAKLIVAQQAYSSNAKSITTFNQVSQATLAMIQ